MLSKENCLFYQEKIVFEKKIVFYKKKSHISLEKNLFFFYKKYGWLMLSQGGV